MVKSVRILVVVALAVLVSTSAFGWVAAQDEPASGFLGVSLSEEDNGIVVSMIMPDSAAAAADLQEGDVITAVNGVEVATPEDVVALISELKVGDTVTLGVLRGEEDLTLEATLGERPADVGTNVDPRGEGRHFNMPDLEQMIPGMMQGFSIGNGRLGVSFATLDTDVAAEHDLTVTDGALVMDVVADSPAATAGLLVDDVITAVNGEPVDAERTLRDRLFAYEPEDVVTLTILRGTETLTLDVTLGEQIKPEGRFFSPDGNGEFHFEIPMPGDGEQSNGQSETRPNL